MRRLTRADVGVPALLAAVAVTEVALVRPSGLAGAIALEIAACACLVWRRLYPLVSCLAAGSLVFLIPWLGPELNDLATPIFVIVLVAFSLARWRRDLRGLIPLALVLAAVLVAYLFTDERAHGVGDVVFVAALTVPPYVFGRLARRLALQADELREHHEWVRREAIRDERDRIARELHDVIAHSVSAMVVQTAAAQDLLRTDPDRAARHLEHVALTGRQALAETGQLLHLVRDDADELGLRPPPGLRDVPELIERCRAEGLAVDLGGWSPPRLPAGADASAYRIVQEILTNALRYSADRKVSLDLESDARSLVIRTRNRAARRPSQGGGLGLLGLTERVHQLGGSLDYGVRADGVFELVASLPVAAT